MFKKNHQHCQLRDFFNLQLPFHDDQSFLKSAIHNGCVLHEMLMRYFRRLRFQKYEESAARIMMHLPLSPLNFYSVPIAAAGKVDHQNLILSLSGSVYSRPIFHKVFVDPNS